jgi:hypothetical protein
MLKLLIILGWVIAVGLLIHLVVEAVKYRVADRNARKKAAVKAEQFKEHHKFDEEHPEEAHHFHYRRNMLIIYAALFVWETFWVLEIIERIKLPTHSFQLPYFFLTIVLVGIPLAVIVLARRIMRPDIHPS